MQGHSELGVWQWVWQWVWQLAWQWAQLRCFQQLQVISVHLKAHTEDSEMEKRSEITVSSSCCKESLIHQAVRLVLKTCSPPLKTDYIQLTLTNWKVPVRLNFNYYPMIFFGCAGQSEDYTYRYRHVETDLCLTMFPALPLLPLLLYPSSSSTTIRFSLIPSPPHHSRSHFLRIRWADATSHKLENINKQMQCHTYTHTLATTLLTQKHYETLDMENIMFWSNCPALEVGLYAVSTTDSLEMGHCTSRILLV